MSSELPHPDHRAMAASIEHLPPTELTIQELAKQIKTEGMGFLHGKFPPSLEVPGEPHDGYQTIGAFFHGEVAYSNSGLARFVVRQPRPKEDYNRQHWTVQSYTPPTETTPAPRRTGIWRLLPDRSTPLVRPKRYMGKQLHEGVKYDYFMPIDHIGDERAGTFVNLTMVVPPEISDVIDVAVSRDPLFPDTLFQALYPGHVGTDTKTHITRVPARELVLHDFRKNPKTSAGIVIPYPTPIPF